MRKYFKILIKRFLIFRFPFLIIYAFSYYSKAIFYIFYRSIFSKQLSSFNYSLTLNNIDYLIHLIAIITNRKHFEISIYFKELFNNKVLNNSLKPFIENKFNNNFEYNGRIINYLIIRAIKPKIIIENGVERGINALLMCEALNCNIQEGYYGKYIGVDINPDCGILIKNNNYNFATLVIEDTIQFLSKINYDVDFYFSDGDRSIDYEFHEFNALEKHINEHSIIISNKCSFSNSLSNFALKKSRSFITFKEDVLNHWYPGTLFGFFY